MPYTSETLLKNIQDNTLPTDQGVLCDYFGTAIENCQKAVLFDMWKQVVKERNLDHIDLHKALVNDKLNALIHEHYKGSDYILYRLFREWNIDIGIFNRF